MRIVFIGAGEFSVGTARLLISKGHEVVIIEKDKARLSELASLLDCSFLHGDGSRPDILREVNPGQTDVLLCLSNSDQVNVIASLIGRSLGFKRVVTSITDPQYESICIELGLKDTIIPSRTICRHLVDMVSGVEDIELPVIIKDEARFFTLIAQEEDAVTVPELKLPSDAKVVCYYRDEKFFHTNDETKFRKGDELVILTHSKNMPELLERWQMSTKDKENKSKEKEGPTLQQS